jgi:hypothetical protein
VAAVVADAAAVPHTLSACPASLSANKTTSPTVPVALQATSERAAAQQLANELASSLASTSKEADELRAQRGEMERQLQEAQAGVQEAKAAAEQLAAMAEEAVGQRDVAQEERQQWEQHSWQHEAQVRHGLSLQRAVLMLPYQCLWNWHASHAVSMFPVWGTPCWQCHPGCAAVSRCTSFCCGDTSTQAALEGAALVRNVPTCLVQALRSNCPRAQRPFIGRSRTRHEHRHHAHHLEHGGTACGPELSHPPEGCNTLDPMWIQVPTVP